MQQLFVQFAKPVGYFLVGNRGLSGKLVEANKNYIGVNVEAAERWSLLVKTNRMGKGGVRLHSASADLQRTSAGIYYCWDRITVAHCICADYMHAGLVTTDSAQDYIHKFGHECVTFQ